MSLLSTVLNALLKSSEVRWVYGRSRVPSRARSTASLAADTKLVWQQEVTSVGVPNNGLRREPVNHVSNSDRAEATVRLAQRCEPASTQHRLSGSCTRGLGVTSRVW
jgi:hypothetical protein